MTDAEIDEAASTAMYYLDENAGWSYVAKLVTEVRRLRAIETTAAQQVEMAARAIRRSQAAEQYAEALEIERRSAALASANVTEARDAWRRAREGQ